MKQLTQQQKQKIEQQQKIEAYWLPGAAESAYVLSEDDKALFFSGLRRPHLPGR